MGFNGAVDDNDNDNENDEKAMGGRMVNCWMAFLEGRPEIAHEV